MSGFGVLSPGALWLTGAVVGLAFVLYRAEGWRRIAIQQLGLRAGSSPRWRITLPLLVAVTMVVGLLRPYYGYREFSVLGVGSDIVVILDVSASMLATDVSPNRLAVAKRKVADIIEALEHRARGDRIGIVLFSGESYFFLPLTADYGVARVFAGAISTELIPVGGSSLGSALELVAKTFDDTGAQAPRVILLSDGEELKLDPEGPANALARRRIAVDVIGIGTPAGHPIDLGSGVLLKDHRGEIVVTRLLEANLRRIAEVTGGSYRGATVADDDVRTVLGGAGALPASGGGARTTVRTYNEFGPWLAALALLLFGAPLLARLRGQQIAGASAVLLLALAGEAGATPSSPFEGGERYLRGDFAGATEIFDREVEVSPERWDLHQALGAARYKKRDFQGAITAFGNGIDRATNGRERFESLYGRGNAEVMSGRFKEAIRDYDEALRIKPRDEDTVYNRGVAEKLLAQQQKQQQEQQQQQRNGGDSERNEQQQQPNDQEQPTEGSDDGAPPKKPEGDSGEKTQEDGAKDGHAEEKPSEGDESDHPEASGTPSPAASPEPAPSAESGAGEREASSNGEPQGGEPPTGAEQGPNERDSTTGNHDPSRLREEEAKSWLQSLDEAPVLLQQRNRRSRQRGEQTW